MQIFLSFSNFLSKYFLNKKGPLGWALLFGLGGGLLLLACGTNHSSSNKPSYSLSGTINIPGHTAVDSDINDAMSEVPPPVSNNSFEDAQVLTPPVILGGFVTTAQAPECAEDGRLCADGDPSDYYQVALSENQVVNLYVSDALEVSLKLYDANQVLLSSKSGTSTNLILPVIETAGDYYIQVEAQNGASNYTLTITSSASMADATGLSPEQDFVPGEFIVRFKETKADTKSVDDSILKAQSLGLTVASQSDSGPLLVRIQDDQKAVLYQNLKLKPLVNNIINNNNVNANKRLAKLETVQTILAMRARSDVLYAEPNYIRKALAITPDDEYYGLQWHYPLIYLPDAWGLIPAGTGSVVVAVVDTGVLMAHPDLSSQLTNDGYDFINDPVAANDGDGRDDNPNDPGDKLHKGISSFHGTHVSGTIAAATDNGSGVAGVAWRTNTKIMPLRALGLNGEGTSFDIIEAVKYAAGLSNVSGLLPDQKADIINLSLGGSASSKAEQDVYDQVRAEGVIVVAAAGNDGSNTPLYPASYSSVISVSAVDSNAELTSYSNYGATIDVAAPGGDLSRDVNGGGDGYPDGILSTLGDDSGASVTYAYAFLEGTSMATPHVAGVCALMKAVKPDLTPDEFDAFLIAGNLTTDIGEVGKDTQYGNGLIDAYSAVLSAQGGDIPTVLKASVSALNFGTDLNGLSLSLQMMGVGNLSITSVSMDASWVEVRSENSSLDLDTDPGTDTPSTIVFDVSVNRPQDFLDGTYSATITFDTTENTLNVPVSMQIISTDSNSNAGYQYIALLDPNTQKIQYMVGATAQNGRYSYQFDNVAAGSYLLVAGTDMDNDQIIGDPGEAYGMYLSKEEPVTINVNSDLAQLDFSSGFMVKLSNSLGTRLKLRNGIQKISNSGIMLQK